MLLADGMDQLVLINHVPLPQLQLITIVILYVELISLDALLLLQDKVVLLSLHANHTPP